MNFLFAFSPSHSTFPFLIPLLPFPSLTPDCIFLSSHCCSHGVSTMCYRLLKFFKWVVVPPTQHCVWLCVPALALSSITYLVALFEVIQVYSFRKSPFLSYQVSRANYYKSKLILIAVLIWTHIFSNYFYNLFKWFLWRKSWQKVSCKNPVARTGLNYFYFFVKFQ